MAVAAGDIVDDLAVAEQTGALAVAQNPDQVLVLGDNQYEEGAFVEYLSEYDKLGWGRLKPITNPVPGNHEYQTEGGDGYFAYFRDPPPYYAFDAGCGWRGYALNSEIDMGEQSTWLSRDLAEHPGVPVLASWHRPRYSSGAKHGGTERVKPLWDALAGREGVILNGHEHHYERFTVRDGFRQFVAGTGGTSTYEFRPPVPGSEQRLTRTPGVLRLELLPTGYSWSFQTIQGTVGDSGTASTG